MYGKGKILRFAQDDRMLALGKFRNHSASKVLSFHPNELPQHGLGWDVAGRQGRHF